MSDCDLCPHPYTEHDGMGDCAHVDGRTTTGFCTRHNTPAPSDAEVRAAWVEWSQASNSRYGEPMMRAFRSGYRIGFAPTTPSTRRHTADGRTPAGQAWLEWSAKSFNTRYGSLIHEAFDGGFVAGDKQARPPKGAAG